jgi:preprotein translocase subunit SecD
VNEVYFEPMVQSFTIGLDLEEGAYLIYQVDYERIDPQEVTGGAMEEVKKKVEHRIGEYPGINGATVQRQGEDKILVQLPGVKDINEAIELIGKTAQLDFREWKGEEDKWVPAKEIVDGEEVELTGALLKPECKAALDRNDNPVVIFHWNKEGAEIFEQVTKRNIGKRLGIFLDDELISAPTIRTVIKGEGIIEGLTWDEAKNLAIQLNSGALDVPLKLISSGKMSTLQAASYD